MRSILDDLVGLKKELKVSDFYYALESGHRYSYGFVPDLTVNLDAPSMTLEPVHVLSRMNLMPRYFRSRSPIKEELIDGLYNW